MADATQILIPRSPLALAVTRNVMKAVVKEYSEVNEYKQLGNLINEHLDGLRADRHKNRQKILEVCHIGKFLLFFNSKITIHQLFEQPDFILNTEYGEIGLEHQIVVDRKSKEKEGFYENIFSIAEAELRDDLTLPNFLANCHLYYNLDFKLNQKEKLIEIITDVVKEYILNDHLIENPIIERIYKMPHSQKSINPNLGAWWQKNITKEIIIQAIQKKESKISNYKKNTVDIQWLLLVIGSTGESSYEIEDYLEIDIDSKFDRIYLLEDFNNKLHQIK